MLTKADKISRTDLDKVAAATQKTLRNIPRAYPELIVTSSEKGLGIDILRATVARLMRDHAR